MLRVVRLAHHVAFPALTLTALLIAATAGGGPGGWSVPQGTIAQESAPAEHVVLVSIDGLRPEFYRDASWPAPTLQQMAREGASADGVRGVFPTVTYPSHTTIITGAMPARHGIYYNEPFDPDGQTGRWYWEEDLIRVPTLWDAVRTAGGTSASFFWPVSVGAPVDYNVPEIWSLEAGYGSVDPLRWNDTPDGFVEELESNATGPFTDGNLSPDYMTRDLHSAAAVAYTLETYRPTLVTVHILGVDHFEHEDGRDSPRVRQAVASADAAVHEMIDGAKRAGIVEHTAFVVVGDHGFVDIHTALAPNVWLVEAGLREARDDRGDWRAAFHSGVASAFLYLRDPDDTETLQAVRRILENRPRAERRLYRIVDRDELVAIGAAPDAALALAFVPGVAYSSAYSGEALRYTGGGTHGYYPDFAQIETGFVASGAGVRTGVVVPEMGLEDVAPTIAQLLGLPFAAPDGTLYPGLFERQ
ncbi:MAG: ectonucleotide pyrophosphatase/phosphodiesterase [Acidobacteriota bacterium]|jgi:predicted AlkP superfamily pyrophosphatase or phosphodiesterase